MTPLIYDLAGITQDDGTSDGTVRNLGSNILAMISVAVLVVVAWSILSDLVKGGSPNEKIKNALMWGGAGLIASAIIAYLPKLFGMGDNFITSILG